jgi:hypothetical protein
VYESSLRQRAWRKYGEHGQTTFKRGGVFRLAGVLAGHFWPWMESLRCRASDFEWPTSLVLRPIFYTPTMPWSLPYDMTAIGECGLHSVKRVACSPEIIFVLCGFGHLTSGSRSNPCKVTTQKYSSDIGYEDQTFYDHKLRAT